MALVARLLTVVDVADDGSDRRRMSVSARHEAVLADGRRVVLSDDRGWSGQLGALGGDAPSEHDRRLVDGLGIWARETEAELIRTARVVVGPDEPSAGRTQADMRASHWEYLARNLREHGVEVEAAELKGLPHDVELSARLLARIDRDGPPRS